MSEFYIEEFVTTKAGDPYRLLPYGVIHKNGKKRNITPEYAQKFKLPHFKPPIKLGSHEETTPAGGHMLGIELRSDGIYVIPEYVPNGLKAIEEGAYRYHSPEIIFEGSYEDPNTGEMIEGPLIVGDALLHMPHLGEATAFYKSEIQEEPMTEQVKNEQVDTLSLVGKLLDFFKAKEQPESEQEPKQEMQQPENFEAIVSENAELKAKVEKFEAEQKQKEVITALVSKLKDKQAFGSMYVELETANEAAGMLASMTPEQQEWVMKNFSALVAQSADVEKELGSEATNKGADPETVLNAAIEAKAKADNVPFHVAMEALISEKPEMFKAKEE